MKAILILTTSAMALAMAPSADAASVCGERDVLLQKLEARFGETPQAIGLTGDGGVLEVLASPEGGWTMLVTYPKRPTCIVSVGKAWQVLVQANGTAS